jgi:hypothetical protein
VKSEGRRRDRSAERALYALDRLLDGWSEHQVAL